MQGVVPAAGRGTRLGSLTDETPKGLVEVAGRPLLTHVFETLVEAGVDELIVIVGYEGDHIIEYYGDSVRDVPIRYVWQDDQRGLGHAVLQAAPAVDGPFVVLNGDNVFGGGIAPALVRARRPGVDGVLLVEEAPPAVAATTGVVETDDGTVTALREKPDDPATSLVTTGCYVLPPAVFRACRRLGPSDRGEYELSEAVDGLVAAGYTIEPLRLEGCRVNVNDPTDIDSAASLVGRES